ncbi:MAG TPA: VOC family protein [Cyclobacteriaceae bacterium]
MNFIFDHIVLNVDDIDTMIQFYTEILQLPGEDIFGKAALFSAALHFNRDSVFKKAQRGEILSNVKIYGVVGELEFSDIVNFPEDNETLFNILTKQRVSTENLSLKIDPDGAHRIAYWEREFKGAIEFLF